MQVADTHVLSSLCEPLEVQDLSSPISSTPGPSSGRQEGGARSAFVHFACIFCPMSGLQGQQGHWAGSMPWRGSLPEASSPLSPTPSSSGMLCLCPPLSSETNISPGMLWPCYQDKGPAIASSLVHRPKCPGRSQALSCLCL